MNDLVNIIVTYAPYYTPFLAALVLILFTKQHLFQGMVSMELFNAQIERERNIVKGQEAVANHLEEIVHQLEILTRKVSEEIGQNTERLSNLERAMSDYLEAFRQLNYNFEKHRKNIPETQKFQQPTS